MGASDVQPSLRLDLPAAPETPRVARHEVRDVLAGMALDAAAIALAVSEAVTNAVIHAYRDRDPADDQGRVRVTLEVDAQGVLVVVDDDGVGMSPRPDSPGFGVGLPLIANLCDDFAIYQRAGGTSVQMRFGLTDAGEDDDHRG